VQEISKKPKKFRIQVKEIKINALQTSSFHRDDHPPPFASPVPLGAGVKPQRVSQKRSNDVHKAGFIRFLFPDRDILIISFIGVTPGIKTVFHCR